MDETPEKSIWPCLAYADAFGAIEFLTTALGFVSTLTVPGEAEGSVAHAELRWPEGGGLMLGSADPEGNELEQKPTGATSVYIVTDDPDGLHDRALEHGAVLVRGLVDEDYGSRGFTIADPEGNLFSFGTYRGT